MIRPGRAAALGMAAVVQCVCGFVLGTTTFDHTVLTVAGWMVLIGVICGVASVTLVAWSWGADLLAERRLTRRDRITPPVEELWSEDRWHRTPPR